MKEDTNEHTNESVHEEIGNLDLVQRGVLDFLLLKGKDGLTIDEIGNRSSIKDALEELRKDGLVYRVEEQRGTQWTFRYFVKEETLKALDDLFLGFIIDNPGVTTHDIVVECPYSYKTILDRLSELTKKGYIRVEPGEQKGKITEKWYATVEVA